MQQFDVPIVLFIFRRLDTVKLILDEIEKIQPSKMYVFADAARPNNEEEATQVAHVREYVTNKIKWNCDVYYEFASSNMGCANRIVSGINYVFSKEEKAIIFEDDAVPKQEYFEYCRELLEKYEKDERIQYIGGFNFVGDESHIKTSYTFCFLGGLTGAFATWADRWNSCDFKMSSWPMERKEKKLRKCYKYGELYRTRSKALHNAYLQISDGWDYQFHYDGEHKGRFGIVPQRNLAESYGYTEGAFHVQEKRTAERLKKRMMKTEKKFIFPMEHPAEVILNEDYEALRQRVALEVTGNYFERHIRYVKIAIKDVIYPIYAFFFKRNRG